MTEREQRLFDEIRAFLPAYLPPDEAHDLRQELRRFPDNTNYYTARPELRSEETRQVPSRQRQRQRLDGLGIVAAEGAGTTHAHAR